MMPRIFQSIISNRDSSRDQPCRDIRGAVAGACQASGTSRKTELKLTNVARASLEELRLDYEDFLRQRGMAAWPPEHPALMRFKAKRCATLEQVRAWVEQERRGQTRTNTDRQGREKLGSCACLRP